MMARKSPPPTAMPMSDSANETQPVARLARNPAKMPGSVMTSGMIWWVRSMTVITTSADRKTIATGKREEKPNTA